MDPSFEGIHYMMPTPFNGDGSTDEESFTTLVDMVANSGCAGLVCLGGMGEFKMLLDNERAPVIKGMVKEANGRLKVIVGCSSPGNKILAHRVREAQELGADAVMVAPPPLARPNENRLFEYYKTANDVATVPMVVQDMPAEAGTFMSPAFYARLAGELEHVQMVKQEDAPAPPKITSIRQAVGDKVGVFGGLGGLFLFEELMRGACGTMTGFAYPEVLATTHRLVAEGEVEKARMFFYKYVPLIRYEDQKGINMSVRKEILRHRGALRNATARQSPLIDEATKKELYDILEHTDLPW